MNGPATSTWPKDEAKEFLTLRMSQMHSYHDHKETMAHAALLVQLAIVGGVISTDPWPPSWVPSACLSGKELATVAVAVIALLVHLYMRWQLQRRRAAALYVGTILKVFLQWGHRGPTDSELKPWSGPPSKASAVDTFFDSLVPWKASRVHPDEGLVGYPSGFVEEMRKADTGAVRAEALVSYGSIFLILIILVRGLS